MIFLYRFGFSLLKILIFLHTFDQQHLLGGNEAESASVSALFLFTIPVGRGALLSLGALVLA